MPPLAIGAAVPLSGRATNALEVDKLPAKALADHGVTTAMLSRRKALEIFERIVVPVLVLVVDLMTRRNGAVSVFPHMPMEEAAARLSAIEVAPMHRAGTVRVAAIPVPAILDDFSA
jgi:hypothetical protein